MIVTHFFAEKEIINAKGDCFYSIQNYKETFDSLGLVPRIFVFPGGQACTRQSAISKISFNL